MRRERKPKEPDVSIEVAKWGDEAADIAETRAALAEIPRDLATGHRLASVAGCSAQDLVLFRCEPNAIVSLTPATRRRLRDWVEGERAR